MPFPRLRSTPLINHLLPTCCLLCTTRLDGKLLCDGCELDLPWVTGFTAHCEQCALPLPTASRFCGECLRRPPPFNRTFTPFVYGHPVDYLISSFKYRRNLACGNALGQLLGAFLQSSYAEQDLEFPELIVPVPLHWTRRWQRRFNQAELIATSIASALKTPVANNLCSRKRRTPKQKGSGRRLRQANLRGAFRLSANASTALTGKCVALVDDVVTTTATVREISKLLMDAGARDVHVWALARTPAPR